MDNSERIAILKRRDGVFSYEIERWDTEEEVWIPRGGRISFCATEAIAIREGLSGVPWGPQARAEVELLPTEQSGRTTPIRSGYRPQMHVQGDESDWVMAIEAMDPEPLEPGSSGTIGFNLVSWETLPFRLFIGLEFDIREGYTIQGRGVITSLKTGA